MGFDGPSATLDGYGEGGVQVDDLERVAHELLELGDRGVVVDGLDGEQPGGDVGVREAVQLAEQQLGLSPGRQRVRVRKALPVGGLPQQEADLEALGTARALDGLGAGALAALAQPTEGDAPAQVPTRLDLFRGGVVPAVQLEAGRYGETTASGDDVGDQRVEGCAQLLPLAVEGGDTAAGQLVPGRRPSQCQIRSVSTDRRSTTEASVSVCSGASARPASASEPRTSSARSASTLRSALSWSISRLQSATWTAGVRRRAPGPRCPTGVR